MNRFLLGFILIPILTVTSFASEIMIAPLAVYDGNGDRTVPPSNPSETIRKELDRHWFEGLLNFSCPNESKVSVPVTVVDANRVCITESSDYLLYGYIKKNENSWQAEIKMFSASERKIIKEFFAGDSIEHYDRMLNDLCRNILYGIEEITGLNKDQIREENTREMELNIPASIFYWNPIDNGWGGKILGIAGLSAGADFYPVQKIKIKNGKLVDYSLRLNLAWDIGVNKKETYPLVINSISIALPFLVHAHLDERHTFYGGTGFGYEAEFMSIRPKYEGKKILYQNVFLLETIFGYEYNFNEFINLYTEMAVDNHLMGDGFVAIKTCFGVSFKIYKKVNKDEEN